MSCMLNRNFDEVPFYVSGFASIQDHVNIITILWQSFTLYIKLDVLLCSVNNGFCDLANFCLEDESVQHYVENSEPSAHMRDRLLEIACGNKDRSMIDILLKAKCKVYDNNKFDGHIMICVKNNDSSSMAAIYINGGHGIICCERAYSILEKACYNRTSDCLSMLLDSFSIASQFSIQEEKLLRIALVSQRTNVVKFLLRRNLEVNSSIVETFGWTRNSFKAKIRTFIVENNLSKTYQQLL